MRQIEESKSLKTNPLHKGAQNDPQTTVLTFDTVWSNVNLFHMLII